MQIHALEQGSDAWNQFRLTHYGASEAAVMLGLSKKATRSELLRMKHLGDAKKFSEWVQTHILDHGHQVEAMARPIVEDLIGDELYPVTCSTLLMPAWASYEISASCDGLTMTEDTAFEHKQYNTELFASVKAGIVPEEHLPQCQQVLLVTGAQRLYFVVSDGTEENMAYAVVTPDQAWFDRILAGWCQFDKDLAAYQLPEAEKVLAAEPVKALPAVFVQVSGQIEVRQNFDAYEVAVRSFLDGQLIREPKTDQDFVDLDGQIKMMKEAETALDAAEAQMLAQISNVDDAKRQKDLLAKLLREHRLMAEKLLASEKERRRAELIETARKSFSSHVAAIQEEIVGVTFSASMPDFAGAIKGLKTLTSMQDKLDAALANGNAESDQKAADIRKKLAWVNENADAHRALLPDLQILISKPMEDFTLTVTSRIEKDAARQVAERDRIRQEEADRLERQTAMQQQNLIAERAQESESAAQAPRAAASTVPAAMTAQRREPTGQPTLRLGQICERIAPLSITADGLAALGFVHSGTDKAAKLYHESEFQEMCQAIASHVIAAANQPRKEAA
ncbi:YqaJ viral recombinase family protein [Herbaspirillum robiniae]|uniref:YqaJ viral recombinase family protein n=1 Tax=Herbaspirillum robiniae TaxID=2014887 RepID=UPI0009A180D2|nr:YqaJ viral recombinase family protein [Herbaspirillum robiniae]